MSELTEFEQARRRRRRKKNWRRTRKLAALLAVIAVFGLLFFAGRQLGWGSYLTNAAASLRGGKGFPVMPDRQETRQLIGMKGGVALCAEGSVTVYNTGGVVTGEFLHSYNNPVSVYSGGRLLTYDAGGTDWLLTNKTKTLQSGTGQGILLGGTLNDKGTAALSRRGGSGLSAVTVYNARGEEIFLLESGDSYLSVLALNDKGTWLAAGGVTSSGGALGCAVKLHDMTGRQPAVSLGWEDEILLKLQWRGETLLAVTNRGARVISTGGAVLEEARFAEAPTAIAIGASGLYIACGDSREAAGVTVTAYDAELNPVGTKTVAERVLSLSAEKNHVWILTESTLLLGDAALAEVTDREEVGIRQIAPWQNSYYCITEEGLTRRKL